MWVCVFVCLCVVSVFYVTSQILKHHSINDIHSMRCRVSHFTIHTDHVESFLKCISYNGRVRYSSNSNRKDRYLSRSLMFEHFTCNVTNKCTQIHTKWKKKPVVEIFVALSHSLLDWTTVDIVINAITPWTLIVCRFFFFIIFIQLWMRVFSRKQEQHHKNERQLGDNEKKKTQRENAYCWIP